MAHEIHTRGYPTWVDYNPAPVCASTGGGEGGDNGDGDNGDDNEDDGEDEENEGEGGGSN